MLEWLTYHELRKLNKQIKKLRKEVRNIMHTLDEVLAETHRGTTIEASMETLLTGISDQLKQRGLDAATVDAVFSELKARNDAAAAAIVANTPAAPTPPTT